MRNAAPILLFAIASCGHPAKPATVTPPAPAPLPAAIHGLALPGAPADGVLMDYLAYDPATDRVWVPAGNTGKVDVIDATTEAIQTIDGFKTQEMERKGQKRTVGPSSATVGDGIVYVGNRGDFSVCAFDAKTLAKGGCVTLASMPDGLAYAASTHEVWVTTPRDASITILDITKPNAPVVKQTLTFDGGEPEGFAVDEGRGVFYTNLENKDKTLAIDLAGKQTRATWESACGEDGPKGLALDRDGQFLVVACADGIETLDVTKDGAILSKLETGGGVDAIDELAAQHRVYVAAGETATLTVAGIDEHGVLTALASIATAPRARNAVGSASGAVFVADTPEGKILVAR